ncbi:MAG: SDR family NAD(P)-dependent oxidoreductase [Acidimicrobiia bacterium]
MTAPGPDLEGKVALVTGASRGVGAATAVALAEAGCAVACAARATDATPLPIPGTLDDTVRRVTAAGGIAIAVPTNLAVDDEVRAMVDTTVARLGPVDVLVNNAAITFPGDIELAMQRFDLVFDVDLRAPVIASQAVVPAMIERGSGAIVNVSSAAALNYYPGQMAYGMAKAALEHLTMSLAAQLRPHGIPVNTFRIDIPVASEGFVAALPDVDHSEWEPPEVAAEGILWVLRQPPEVTGRQFGMARLRDDAGIMASRAARPHVQSTDMVTDSSLDRDDRRGT